MVESLTDKRHPPSERDRFQRHAQAEDLVAQIFKDAGWGVTRQTGGRDDYRPDLLVRRREVSYAVEIKVGAEGRSDRLIPLWSQACLQAAQAARGGTPLAVIAAPEITRRVAEQILNFAERFAPDVAAGVIDFAGFRLFRGPHLESLNAEAQLTSRLRSHLQKQSHLFSDLNQWMLKVLLAPELPVDLLSAPRRQYRNASDLARAADVSVMSAFRFVQQLQREGYLNESASYLELVRRQDLFRRWQFSSVRKANETPMRFLLGRRKSPDMLHRMLDGSWACLALFAAADALGFGHVSGVPPYVYVRRLDSSNMSAWRNLVPLAPGERPDIIVRQAVAPESVFRGVVRPTGLPSCDVLQVWLDVFDHPSRGQEQADLIRNRVLAPLLEGKDHG